MLNIKNPVNIIAVFCACFLLTAAFLMFMPVSGEHDIYQSLIRLHVLPNSGSPEDQNLKLEVRDYILGEAAALTQNSENSAQAAEKIREALPAIEAGVQNFVNQRGYDYAVRAVLSREVYPTRAYEDSTGERFYFPSGAYQSLSIIIGGGDGGNWWCVLFPPICLSGSKIEEELAVMGYSGEQINILRRESGGKYVIRFRILEILADWFR
jgi:stage II sporulation protein R